MNQEQKLTQHILEKYKPLAIVLHGSRASGFARERSDWDFIILVDKETEVEREIIDGANMEVMALKLPFKEQKIIGDKWLALRKGNSKVLHEVE